MALKFNSFIYETANGLTKGYFNIYQARNGSLMLCMGNSTAPLSKEQIEALHIDCYELKDFDDTEYTRYYYGSCK